MNASVTTTVSDRPGNIPVPNSAPPNQEILNPSAWNRSASLISILFSAIGNGLYTFANSLWNDTDFLDILTQPCHILTMISVTALIILSVHAKKLTEKNRTLIEELHRSGRTDDIIKFRDERERLDNLQAKPDPDPVAHAIASAALFEPYQGQQGHWISSLNQPMKLPGHDAAIRASVKYWQTWATREITGGREFHAVHSFSYLFWFTQEADAILAAQDQIIEQKIAIRRIIFGPLPPNQINPAGPGARLYEALKKILKHQNEKEPRLLIYYLQAKKADTRDWTLLTKHNSALEWHLADSITIDHAIYYPEPALDQGRYLDSFTNEWHQLIHRYEESYITIDQNGQHSSFTRPLQSVEDLKLLTTLELNRNQIRPSL